MVLNPYLAWFAVMFMAFVMLLQTAVIFVLFTKAGKQLRSSQGKLSSLLSGIGAGTTALRQLLAHTEGVPTKLSDIESRTPPLLARIHHSISEFDEGTAAFVDRSRSYLYQFDQAADIVLSNFSTQTFRVHRAIIHPAIRFSTLLQSIQAVAGRVFPDDESPASHPPDQEIFI